MIPNDIFETLIGALAIAAVKATVNVTDGDAQTRQLIRIKEARNYLDQLVVTVPVDATIEALRQSCDELQMQVDSEKANTEYTEQLYEQALQRIGELEQLQTQPVWEPVEDGFVYTFDTGMDTAPELYVASFDSGDDQAHLSVGRTNVAYEICYLPDNIRLCRLVQQQPQENSSHE